MTPHLLKALSGESIGRFPVWLMRQAGRYLPRYRAIRAEHSFWESVQDPKLASEITLLPFEVIDVDAAILFSDILTLPHAIGYRIELKESVGPVIDRRLEKLSDFARFQNFDAGKHVPYVGEALARTRSNLAPEKALIGFAGAPWTVACYLVCDRTEKNFRSLVRWVHEDPETLALALESIGEATAQYLAFQIASGAQIVQLFDTWASEIPKSFFDRYYVHTLNRIFAGIQRERAPAIYFAKHSTHLGRSLQSVQADVLGVDALQSLTDYETFTEGKFSLQGNLDPTLLFADPATVRRHTRELVQNARTLRRPAILNLGHGILPGTPVESVQAFVQEARTLWI